ncbi:hypothetical protein MTBPR1_100179 [Candidatus Terasakiella magnetica]|uniref:Uncharacterized protein n=1 Tax=Candidatus Terasakiella magnetica TaxID=1867952 RepID=A0A1C3RE81_9PROT|nr:hypothetical protein [Candidatus Terasakiella magnetica]SCA55538.1 hypothetical protein MTBPR1_100179 [Candidatus Terasakiella magnetica]
MLDKRDTYQFDKPNDLMSKFVVEEDDIDLFDDEPDEDDFELFGDDPIGQEEPLLNMPSDEDILKAAENFKDAFAGEEQALSAASGAIVLHQHLSSSGYKTDLSLNDNLAVVLGYTDEGDDECELLEAVESILTQMVSMNKDFGFSSFTVGPVRTLIMDGKIMIEVNLITV